MCVAGAVCTSPVTNTVWFQRASNPNCAGLIMHSCAGRIMNHLNVLPGMGTEVWDIEDFSGIGQTVTQFHQLGPAAGGNFPNDVVTNLSNIFKMTLWK